MVLVILLPRVGVVVLLSEMVAIGLGVDVYKPLN